MTAQGPEDRPANTASPPTASSHLQPSFHQSGVRGGHAGPWGEGVGLSAPGKESLNLLQQTGRQRRPEAEPCSTSPPHTAPATVAARGPTPRKAV